MKLTVMMPRLKQRPTNGSDVLKMEELQQMMMGSLAELELQDPNL
jgi:hypothetical protein